MAARGDNVVIVGASLAGLATAQAIAPYFAHITIVEPDLLPTGIAQRRGVPQGLHLHGLLNGGRAVFDTLFGNFTEEMLKLGAPYFDGQLYGAYRFPEGWLPRTPGTMKTLCGRRTAFEHVARSAVIANPKVEIISGTVRGLLASQDGKSIAGVRYLADQQHSEIKADLIIDASGRPSRSPNWVSELGFAPPVETIVKSYLGYATLFAEVPADAWPDQLRGLSAPPFPGRLRGGFLVPQDDGTTGIMAAGQSREYPPATVSELGTFLEDATTPLIRDILRAGRPVSEIEITRTSHNRLRNWHLLADRPERFVVVGDALAAYNPVYGQGMTGAALQAMAIARTLERATSLDELARDAQAEAFAAIAFAWSAATESDLAFEATVTENLDRATDEDSRGYFRAVRSVATIDADVAAAFMEAMHMQDPAILVAPELRETVLRRYPQVAASDRPISDYPPPLGVVPMMPGSAGNGLAPPPDAVRVSNGNMR